VLRNIISKLIKDYSYIIIDNEAGLEHLSRRTTRAADTLLVVSDATPVGLKAAKRINALTKELKIDVKKRLLLINRFNKELESEKISDSGLELAGYLPQDEEISELSLTGKPIMVLNNSSKALEKLRQLGDKIWLN
jgi:CO dehydrogenase maturation factor